MTPRTVRAAQAEAARRLSAGGVSDPARDARVLMAAALGIAPDRLVLEAGSALPDAARVRLDGFVAERLRFRPVAQIVGRRQFWGRWFAVTSDVLDPRPETELLVAVALAGPAPRRILDLGTGSGVILLTLLAEWPDATGVGTDASDAALGVASANAAALGLARRAVFVAADWWQGLDERFDLVVSNPPYIPTADLAGLSPDVRDWEPAAALSPGSTGLEAYRSIAAGLAAGLAEGGRALFEIGAGQGPEVTGIFRAEGFRDVGLAPDLDGRDRVAIVARPLAQHRPSTRTGLKPAG